MTQTSSIANIFGPERVRSDMETRARYAIGDQTPAEVVLPTSAAEVVEIVKHAASERRAVVASGARTKLDMGAPPSKYDIAIDLSQMNRIVAYDPGDLTLSVEPGVTLASLARTLAEHGQMLPLGTPWSAHATIGGTIASGIDAPERQLYGTPRDYLLGAEFVTGDGVLAKSGGRVVKNVTGYDLHKLLIGSFGTLGIITKLNFKTFPLPPNVRGFAARFDTLAGALAMRAAIARSPLSPITLDIVSPSVTQVLGGDAAAAVEASPMPTGVLSDREWAVAVGYAGSERVLARYETDLRQIAEQCGAASTHILSDGLNAAWSRLREFVPIALASSAATTVIKVGVLPSRLAELWSAIVAGAAGSGVVYAAVIRGVGVAYIAVPASDAGENAKRCAIEFTQKVESAAMRVGGQAAAPWSPAAWKRDLAVWGAPPTELNEMRKLKTALDPQNILSPGRFVGGI